MLRLVLVSVFVAALSVVSPVSAAGDNIERLDFRGIDCSDPRVKEMIIEQAKGMKFENGRLFVSVVSNLRVTRAETVRATNDTLACRIRLSMVYAGSTQSMRALFTLRQFGSGKLEAVLNFTN